MMLNQKLDIVALDKLQLPHEGEPDLAQWIEFVDKVKHPNNLVHIALVGKYTELPDAYKSIVESFVHAGAANHTKVKLHYVNSEKITPENIAAQLKGMCGILVAPGFGHRGIEGKITAVKYARENGTRSLASASACSAPSWSSPAIPSVMRMPIRRKWRIRRTR